METISVMMVVCLLAGLSECQTGGENNQTKITGLTHEDLEDNSVEKDAFQNSNQGLETPAILTTKTTTTQPSCEPPIYTVLKELGALEERLAATVTAMEETNKKLEANEKKLTALDGRVTELSAVDQGHHRVAFSATLGNDGIIGPVNIDYSLVYRNVLSNIGGHYNPVTGFFTAPVQGVYYFTYTSFSWAGSGTSGGSLYQNGNKIVSWYGHAPTNELTGSNSAILQLQVGDYVNVRLWRDMKISENGNNYCSFSGYLLFPV
ncbi:complement C1q-like protein 2 [Etheostoma spectabile]|nr:complement C1q-like protein 2 [Etheostoma spectabile]